MSGAGRRSTVTSLKNNRFKISESACEVNLFYYLKVED